MSSMSLKLFEAIEKQGLISGNEVNLRKVKKLSSSEIIDFAFQTGELTSSENFPQNKSTYAFSASLSMRGGTYPCCYLKCRLDKAKKFLAQFSAFYSDHVYINYYPSDYLDHVEEIESSDVEEMQAKLVDDLTVLIYLRPLIETEKIIPITHPNNYCPHCLAVKIFGNDADRFEKIITHLTKRYNKEMTVTLEKFEDDLLFNATASETLIEHGTNLMVAHPPYGFDIMPQILSQLNAGKKIALSTSEIRKFGLDKHMASIIRDNLIFEMATTQLFNTRYLTNSNLDIEILKRLSGNPTIYERNQLINKYLHYLVPFIENANPIDLLKIRQSEEDAFIVFRKGLNQAIDEYKKKGMKSRKMMREEYMETLSNQSYRN